MLTHSSGSSSHEKAGSTGSQGGGAGAAASAPNFTAITDVTPQDALYGPLEQKDLEWTCAGGFATETQTWYTILKDGSFATSQIIHSGVGLWYPQIQVGSWRQRND